MTTLWAKSRPAGGRGDPPTVAEHCRAVREAADALWSCIERDLAVALGLDQTELRQRVRSLFLVAALLHDVAKANSAFQALVQGPSAEKLRQPIRHEVLAAVLITSVSPRLWGRWFSASLTDRDLWAVAWAVGGHHLELRDRREGDKEDPVYRTGNVPRTITLHLDELQVRDLVNEVAEVLSASGREVHGLPPFGAETFSTMEEADGSIEPLVHEFVCRSRRMWRELQKDQELKEFKRDVALLKALLIAADVAGSALPADGTPVGEWVQQALSIRLTPQDLASVVRDNLQGRPVRDFQRRVGESAHIATVVTAGCGNGKTTAAYLWAQQWACGRKLFFTYPTTGTASAGYHDYLFGQHHLERALIHSHAWVDLQTMTDSPDETLSVRAMRLESLQAWGQHVIACTVDTVLGLIQNQRRPLFSCPAIACGAFVFDEVHSFDRRLFAELLRFLEVFPGVPVLIMSASIPPARLEALRRVLGRRMSAQVITGDRAQEEVKRYVVEQHESADLCWDEVRQALDGGGKTLWVCNTVADAVTTYREAVIRFPDARIFIFHSRFRYSDRVRRQTEVIEAFRSPGGCIAVTTQICEMSLDISADLLVTALCPLPALVQRLGRLNRYATSSVVPKPCVVYPFAGPPYSDDEAARQICAAEGTIAKLSGSPCSQADLAEALEHLLSGEDWSQPLHSAWLDGGWASEALPAREGDSTITVVREEDLADIRACPGSEREGDSAAKRLVRCTIPMLPRLDIHWIHRVGGYPVAPAGSIRYDDTEGAEWNWSRQT